MSLVVAVRHVGQEHRGEHVSVTTRHQLMGEGVVLVLAILHQHVTLKHVLVGIYRVLNRLFCTTYYVNIRREDIRKIEQTFHQFIVRC